MLIARLNSCWHNAFSALTGIEHDLPGLSVGGVICFLSQPLANFRWLTGSVDLLLRVALQGVCLILAPASVVRRESAYEERRL